MVSFDTKVYLLVLFPCSFWKERNKSSLDERSRFYLFLPGCFLSLFSYGLLRIPSSHLCGRCRTDFFLPFSIPRLLYRFPVWVFVSANHWVWPDCCWYISIFNLEVYCYHDLDFGNLLFPFQFISLLYIYYYCYRIFSLCLCDPYHPPPNSLSLCLSASYLFLIYDPLFIVLWLTSKSSQETTYF